MRDGVRMAGSSKFFSGRVGAAIAGVVLVVGVGVGAAFALSSGGPTRHPASVRSSGTVPTTAAATTTTSAAAPTTTAAVPNPSGSDGSGGATAQGGSRAAATGGAPAAAPAQAPPAEEIIVCVSPNQTNGGVQTGSETAYRAPAGTPPPPGCHLG
jgi:hypothetical protein